MGKSLGFFQLRVIVQPHSEFLSCDQSFVIFGSIVTHEGQHVYFCVHTDHR